MFRVDPIFKYISLIPSINGGEYEDYDFVRLMGYHPVWILHLRDGDWVRLMADNLLHALELAARPRWKNHTLYVLLPSHMTSERRLTTSLVTKIWECRAGRNKDRRFEISTESGVYRLNEAGSAVRKTLRKDLVWISDMSAVY